MVQWHAPSVLGGALLFGPAMLARLTPAGPVGLPGAIGQWRAPSVLGGPAGDLALVCRTIGRPSNAAQRGLSSLDHVLHVGASGRGEVSGKASEQRRR